MSEATLTNQERTKLRELLISGAHFVMLVPSGNAADISLTTITGTDGTIQAEWINRGATDDDVKHLQAFIAVLMELCDMETLGEGRTFKSIEEMQKHQRAFLGGGLG